MRFSKFINIPLAIVCLLGFSNSVFSLQWEHGSSDPNYSTRTALNYSFKIIYDIINEPCEISVGNNNIFTFNDDTYAPDKEISPMDIPVTLKKCGESAVRDYVISYSPTVQTPGNFANNVVIAKNITDQASHVQLRFFKEDGSAWNKNTNLSIIKLTPSGTGNNATYTSNPFKVGVFIPNNISKKEGKFSADVNLTVTVR